MSEFFTVTLQKDVVIDDSVTNSFTGWTGEKILGEINKHRVTKFEELTDVDVINRKDKQIIAYSGDTGKFTSIDLSGIGEAAGLSLRQISKMGIIGSPSVPKIVDIPISTLDFKVPRINVLKFQLGDQNVIKTENGFTNSESSDFQVDDLVVFDGTAHLKTIYDTLMTNELDIETYKVSSVLVNKTAFKNINSMVVNESGVGGVLSINAIPPDRLLIPIGDINLSNASSIDYFNIVATSGVKVICSVDGGISWKTFKNNTWVDTLLTVEDVELNGMDGTLLNSINSIYWNNLITTNKIRFAYLLKDNNNIDELKLQYDGLGFWVEAKNTEYDVMYASNSLLQVKIYFSSDVKINY